MTKILTGNLNNEAPKHRGWVIGHFMESGSPFQNQDFEIKWGKHEKEEARATLSGETEAASLAVLIYGRIIYKIPSLGKDIILEKEGDYFFFSRNLPHTWEMLEDTLILTIRWPSIPPEKSVK